MKRALPQGSARVVERTTRLERASWDYETTCSIQLSYVRKLLVYRRKRHTGSPRPSKGGANRSCIEHK